MVDYRKLSYRLIIILALCLMAVPSLALPAVALNGGIGINTPSPSSGMPGTTVTITGNYTPGETVNIYFGTMWRAEATVLSAGTFSATFDVPNTYRGLHTIRAEASENATIYAERNFNVQSGLTVEPEEGQVGDTVTVVGRGYGEDETGIQLYFDGQRVLEDAIIAADADGFWTEIFAVPPSVRGSHIINTQPSVIPRHATFTVGPGIRLNPASGSPGQSITVTGGGFVGGERHIKVLFDGEELPLNDIEIRAGTRGEWEESFEVPEMPAGEYDVTAEGHQTEDVPARTFEIVPGIELSPSEGHVGMNVTATGRGFAANEDVTVFYEDGVAANTTADENGSFQVVFAVPESRHGPRQVTAEDAEGNETAVPAIFAMEEDPPDTPELYSPIDGRRVGHIFKVRPEFRWQEVFDLSGVSYTLQISTSANFTDPIVIEDLTGNYTLTREEALPHGTYYWIVQAVDGAENESGWSDPESFRAGRLPLWAFIVIIVFAVLGAGGAGYYFSVKRRMYD